MGTVAHCSVNLVHLETISSARIAGGCESRVAPVGFGQYKITLATFAVCASATYNRDSVVHEDGTIYRSTEYTDCNAMPENSYVRE